MPSMYPAIHIILIEFIGRTVTRGEKRSSFGFTIFALSAKSIRLMFQLTVHPPRNQSMNR